MNNFKNRLKNLRNEANLTQNKLADKLNYSRSTIAQYERGLRAPSNNFLISVANFFEVSLDYLMGRSKIRLSFKDYLSKYTLSIMLFVDPENGKIIDYSHSALDFYKYTNKELLNKTIFDIIILPKEKIIEDLNKAKNSKHNSFYSKHRLANNEIKEVKVTTTTLFIDEKKIISSMIQDINNIKYKNNNDVNNSLIKAISKIHNEKFSYKKFFSKNVANLSYEIGKILSLSNQDLELLKIAALLHDIGEIYLPSEIINKNEKLTNTEFKLIETHPKNSYNILKDVKLDQKIKEIIFQHHERLDGSGYPEGLKDEEILKEAKIIGVADSIVAMLSERPYRKALSKEIAFNILKKNKNKKFDSEIVDICLKLFEDNTFFLIKN